MLDTYLLTLIVFVPLVGALLIATFPASDEKGKNAVRWGTLGTLFVGFLVSLRLWFGFDAEQAGMQFVQRTEWIPSYGISYHLGVDGLSLLLVMLTTFLGPLVMAGAWSAIQDRVKGFCVALLLLQCAMLGSFLALDLFLFYVFWELMLLPLYFIIGIWGGERRIYAAIKLFVFTMTGSLLMLVAVLWLVITFGTSDVLELYAAARDPIAHGVQDWTHEQLWLFGFFALAFAIKVPMFPFHTWLPDAHVEAPTAGSVVLASVLLKMGTYGFVRYAMPLFPQAVAVYAPVICTLAVIGIVYGALVAMVQPDVKKLVAYSSVSHLGYVMLGLFALNVQGIQGGILQMVNHGLSTGALFLLVGMIYERRHTRMIKDFGGLAKVMPVYAFFFMMITFSSVGLPGLNGFIGEMLVLIGAFESPEMRVFAILAALGVVLGAVYMLWMFRRVFFGPITHAENEGLKDLEPREIAILGAILVFVVWIGVYPSTFLAPTAPAVAQLIERADVGDAPVFVEQVRPAEAAAPEPGRHVEGRGDRPALPAGVRVRPRPGEGVPAGAEGAPVLRLDGPGVKRIPMLPPGATHNRVFRGAGEGVKAPPPVPSIVRLPSSDAPLAPADDRRAPQ
jgi:NADH-quinone oxidoreductase subunit M